MNTIRVAIADDEPLARQRLRRLLAQFDEIELVGEAQNGKQLVDLFAALKPDLLILDINMPVMTGLSAAQTVVSQSEPPPAIIFCTAYQEFALDAFKVKAADYLLKPVTLESLSQAIENARSASLLQQDKIASDIRYDSLYVETEGGGRQKLNIQDCAYFRAKDKYVLAGLIGASETLVSMSLKELEQRFSDTLVRSHRSALINKNYLAGLQKTDSSTVVALEGVERPIPVSRRHLAEIKKCFVN